jgi:26S proteasome regulatory subunit N8
MAGDDKKTNAAEGKDKDPKAAAKEKDSETKKADGDSAETTPAAPKIPPPNYVPYKQVVVHPLVLLSVVDHYNRVAKDTKKRVVGILLGETHAGKVDITNSYAVPFEEDPKDPTIWFLDHNYHENMFAMFKKVNAKEKVVGWYSTGPKIRPADMDINDLLKRYTANPVLCIINVNPQDDLEIPTDAYVAIQTDLETRGAFKNTFVNVPSEVGAYEAEEVGVEHLLRDIRDTTESTVADVVNTKLNALKSLKKRWLEMARYLTDVCDGRMPVNHQILYNIQDILNLSPNLKVEDLVKSFAVNTNDNYLVIYVASIIRSIIALHNLINNKMLNLEAERKAMEPVKSEEQIRKEREEREKERERKEKEEKEKKEKEEAERKAKKSSARRKFI